MLTPEVATQILGRRGDRWQRSPERYAVYFKEGQRLLKEKGWTQGAYARSRRGYKLESGRDRNAASFCAQGALERAAPEYRDFKVCKALLGYALQVLPSGRTSISAVNDGHNKAQAKAAVLDAYADVIEILTGLSK